MPLAALVPPKVARPVVGGFDYARWCTLSDDELARLDIGRLNLLAAVGLPGAEGLVVEASLRRLDEWARLVRLNTEHWWRNRHLERTEFRESRPRFRMGALLTMLQKHLGVHYAWDYRDGPDDNRDSGRNFLHGPLHGHGGTCVSLPLLTLAVGRRLGYPLRLVETKQHLFVRWEDADDRFNIESASVGFAPKDDDYYRHWPHELTGPDVEYMRYLVDRTPREELAVCLAERGHCFMDHLRFAEALEAYHWATQAAYYVERAWAVASLCDRMYAIWRRGGHDPYLPLRDQIARTLTPNSEPWQKWCRPHACRELHRILLLHGFRE